MKHPVIPYSRQWIDSSDIEAVVRTLESDFLTQGPRVVEFEEGLARVTGAKHVVAVASGSAALHLAVVAIGASPESYGVTTPITFAASANCFLYENCPVGFCDVDPETGLMHCGSLEEVLAKAPRPGILIPTSLQGRVPDLVKIQALAKRHGFKVLEDAAHSLGSTYECGGEVYRSASCSHTDAAILSFHPVKHICCGEGGAVVTNDDDLAKRLRLLRAHGIVRPPVPEGVELESYPTWYYEQVDLGWNYRLSDLHAALGASQLKRLPDFLARRRVLAKRYYEVLSEEPFRDFLTLPPEDSGNSYHLFVVQFKDSDTRNRVHNALKAQGILTQVHYRPIYQFQYYRERVPTDPLPGAEAYANRCLSIPLFPKMTDEEQERVIEALRALCPQFV